MRQNTLLTRSQKEAPKDEVSKNAALLTRAGFIHKEMAGVYAYLPLGWRVMQNIIQIIREEMNAIGGQELFMTSLQPKDVWEKSGRWSDEVVDNWFRTELANGTVLGLANTHEEPLAQALSAHIRSYKDLPKYAYQFQTKFRNELRAKSGIMRGREFIMKDLYSFSRDEEEFREFYELAAAAYLRIYERVGVGRETYRTFASGGSFSKFSDEFQTVTDAGEDTIYIDEEKRIAVNKEVYTDDVLEKIGLDKKNLVEKRSVEVGNIFPLGTKYSEAVGLMYADENGKEKPVVMGCYGIGPGRLMGTIVELSADENGLSWPETVAPFAVHIVNVSKDEAVRKSAEKLYDDLLNEGIDVLYDDRRDVSAGEKFAESNLFGIPRRVVFGKGTEKNNTVDLEFRDKNRASENESVSLEEISKRLIKDLA